MRFDSVLGHQILYLSSVMAARRSPKPLVGVQVPAGKPTMETWSSQVYGNSLENCRIERFREFESHRFRQLRRSR